MSEQQIVSFRAVDRPLNDQQLEYALQQSTRADVTRWSFECEYNYSSFRGDVDGLLQRGFDVYLQCTNYGDREVRLRLPHGMPFSEDVWSKYCTEEQLTWQLDPDGVAGILTLHPFHEDGDYELLWNVPKYLEAVVGLRNALVQGDLRALYVLWLCAADDDYNEPAEMIEPPVPHGMSDIGTWADDVLELFGLDPLLTSAAAEGVGAAPTSQSTDHAARWVKKLDELRAKDLLLRLLTNDAESEKAELLAEIRKTSTSDVWPTSDMQRTLSDLLKRTETFRDEEHARLERKAKAKAKRQAADAQRLREERMQEMVAKPGKWLKEAERLVAARGVANYEAAAEILDDIRKAVGGEKGEQVIRQCSIRIAKKYPTLNYLKRAWRARNLPEL